MKVFITILIVLLTGCTAIDYSKNNNIYGIQRLIDKKENLDIVDKELYTPLHHAIKNKNNELAILLINSEVDINIISDYHESALVLAVKTGLNDVAKLLIDRGANLHFASYYDGNALSIAVDKKNIELARYLINNGANVKVWHKDDNLLHLALKNRDLKMINLLNRYNIYIDEKSLKLAKALDVKLYNNFLEIKKLQEKDKKILLDFLNKDINNLSKLKDINLHIDLWNDAISLAAKNNRVDQIKTLIKYGANINSLNRYSTPLIKTGIMHNKDSYEMVQFLLDKGVNPNTIDQYKSSLLRDAISYGDIKMARLLIKYKADPYIRDDKNNTLLITAVKQGSEIVFKEVLKYGIDVNTKNFKGKTAKDYADFYGDQYIKSYFKNR